MSVADQACDAATSTANGSVVSLPILSVLVILALPTLIWLAAYILPQLYVSFFVGVPNLKVKYNASWALVTGGGSGIGKALVFKLASQGLNVVVVSLDDEFLKETMQQLKEQYPKLEFRSVGCNFAPGVDYMKDIRTATKDITVQIVFNNAGFLVTGKDP